MTETPIIVWDLKPLSQIHFVISYTVLSVDHRISLFYENLSTVKVEPAAIARAMEQALIKNFLSGIMSSDVAWKKIKVCHSSEGFFTYKPLNQKEFSTAADTERGLRVSMDRYNRETAVKFSVYGIQKDLSLPILLDNLQPLFIETAMLPCDNQSLSLSFRGCATSVQAGESSPVIDISAKYFKIPEKQQARYRENIPKKNL